MAFPPEERVLDMDSEEVHILITFVTYFVVYYEQFLSEYYERLESQRTKPGKWADIVNAVIGTGKDATEGIPAERTKAAVLLGLNIVQKCISSIGEKYNRDRLKQLLQQLENFKETESTMRKILIDSGVEIFLSFANQFLQVTAEGGKARAMQKLADDGVNRVLNYVRKSADDGEDFSSFVIRGVIKGNSKKYQHSSTKIPHITAGHTVLAGNSKWNTAKLYKNVGLVADGKYYKRKNQRNTMFGYRLPVSWEFNDQGLKRYLNDNYQEDETTENKCFKYFLKSDCKDSIKNKIIHEIDNGTMENSLIFKYEIRKCFKDLENILKDNPQTIEDLLKKYKDEIVHNIKEGNKEIIQAVNEGFENLKKRDGLNVSLPILFEVRESVPSFSGREVELKKIADYHANPGIVLIHGLGGVGKTELAVKYARNLHEDHKANIVWIHAETQDKVHKSFSNLLKFLQQKTTDNDNEVKDVQLMAREVYELLLHSETKNILFVFDNAEEGTISMNILPQKCHVLITSQIENLLKEHKHESVRLDILSETEAIDVVKKSLKIEDVKQEKYIKKLVNLMGKLPLALQLAVAYISGFGLVTNIREYIEIYTKSVEESRNFLTKTPLAYYDKAIYITFKTTISKLRQQEHSELAEKILHLIAYCSPDNIPEELFLKKAQDRVTESDIKKRNLLAKANLSKNTNTIAKYSLIKLNEKPFRCLSIHRLVQEAIKLELREKSQEENVLREALELLWDLTITKKKTMASCLPHILSIWRYAKKYEKLVETFIVDNSKNKAITSTTYFMLIIKGCSFEVIDEIIKNINPENLTVVINEKNKDNLTPLHKAVLRKNDVRIVQLLIDSGADVNAIQTKTGWSALHYAANNGNLMAVNALLRKDAEVNVLSNLNLTPLYLAAKNGYTLVVLALLEKHANVVTPYFSPRKDVDVLRNLLNINVESKVEKIKEKIKKKKDMNNEPCVKVSENVKEIVQSWITSGADAKETKGLTPFHIAAKNGNLSGVKTFIGKQVEVNVETALRFTPLHYAAQNGHNRIVELLLENKANLNAETEFKFTPLHLAAENGHLEVIQTLLKLHVLVNVETKDKFVPLHLAAKMGRLSVVEALLEANADINAENKNGLTSLHFATKFGHKSVVEALLVNSSINIDAKTKRGQTAMQMTSDNELLKAFRVAKKKEKIQK